MKVIMLTLLFLWSVAAEATEWEYKVFYLPGNAGGGKYAKLVKLPSGAYVDTFKTNVLNKLGADGWEIIAVTGQSGADHALYMKREKTNPR